MSRHGNLRKSAHDTASRRNRLYGIDPPPAVADLLFRERTAYSLREAVRLRLYILARSPLRRLRFFLLHVTDRDTPLRRHRIDGLAGQLRDQLSEGCRVAVNYFERRNYSRDLARVPALLEKTLHRTTPWIVIQPRSEQDISSVLRFAVSRGLAVYPRGTGSFAFGGAVPTRNGIVLDLSPMMSVLEVDPHERTIRAEPGTRWADLAAALEPHGLVPMTTPTSRFSTIAGWISTGGMGLDSYGYGSVYESVVGVRVVRPDGTAEALDPAEDSLRDLFGTEGQFGILTEVTLRARPKPEHSEAAMLAFDNADQAFGFIRDLNEGDMRPSHVVFFDREFLRKENLLFREHTGAKEAVVPEKEAVLLHFESPESARRFAASQAGREDEVSRNRVGAHYLWADRYFPLKAQRISPGLLGTEVMIPGSEVAGYIRKVRRLAGRFGLEPTTEVIVCRGEASFSYLVIVSFNCDYSRSLHYLLSLLFIQLSVRLAVRSRGGPYGTGIWNAPFVKARFDRGRLRELRRKKHELDPAETLNPGKFFRLKGRFFGIPSLFMRPVPFRMILAAAHAAAPVLGLGARLAGPKRSESWETPPKEEDLGRKLLHQSAQRCTSCGSCLSVCPAYHLTRDELVAGRTKLRMAEAILNGAALKPEEAFSPFQCLHCGLCEEVCQTRLPLRDCYLVLEDLLEDRFGSPADTVQRFVEKLDSDRAYIEDIFGLDLPRWSPSEQRTRVPTIEPDLKGGEA